MAAIPLKHEIHYPESDGRPMGETELHRKDIMDLIAALEMRYREAADVYVGGDMLLYYVEGNPRRMVCPDVFVTFGVPKLPPRRSYFLWDEGKPPSMIIEVTSRSSRREDLDKREVYARIGVEEYFLHDPLGEYLKPALQGFRLVAGKYVPIEAAEDGSLLSETTGLTLRREGERLRLVDTRTGKPLLRQAELYLAFEKERAAVLEERAAVQEERAAREAAEARARAAEEEVARLRRELINRQGD